MAVVKNLMVRVGADISGLTSGMKKGGKSTESFAKQTENALRNSALSLGNLKKAMAQGGKNAAIVSLTDQIRELEAEQAALKKAGFSWGYEGFEENEKLLKSLTKQLNEYKSSLGEPEVPVDVLAQNLRDAVDEAQSLGSKLNVAKESLKQLEQRGLGAGDADWDAMYQSVNHLSNAVRGYKESLTDAAPSLDEVVLGLWKSVEAAEGLGHKLQVAKSALKTMESHGLGAGDAEWDAMYQSVNHLSNAVRGYKESLTDAAPSLDEVVLGLWKSVEAADGLGHKLQVAKSALKTMESHGLGAGDADWDAMYQSVYHLTNAVRDYEKSLVDAGETAEQVSKKNGGLGASIKSAFGKVSSLASKILGLGNHSKKSSAGVEGLLRSIRRIGLVSVGLQLVKSIFGELQSVVNQYVSQNAALQAQVNTLKTSLGQALAPAINVVTNALSVLMPYIVGVSNAIGSLISNLFGSGWTTVADGANSAADAIGGAGSAQKEFNRQLAGFDEINKLNASNNGGGGSSAVTSPVEGNVPTWLSSLSQQIQEAANQGDFFGVGAALAGAINKGINSVNLSDTTLGSKIASLINGGIAGATGFVQTLDWSGLGTAIKQNIVDLWNGIDWGGLSGLLGSATGGIFSFLNSMFSGAFDGLRKTFSESMEECGGDILAGIWLGIKKTMANIGSWIWDNIFVPFVDGFKNTFDIHSPSQNKEIQSLGENIMLGIFEGIIEPLRDPIGWIKEHVFTPISEGFKKVFDGADFLGNLLPTQSSGSFEVKATAKLTKWKDALREKAIAFQSKLTTWKDSLGNKVVSFQTKLTTWKESLSNKVISFQSRLTTWKDGLSNKVISFQSRLTTWKDGLSNKVISFQTKLTTWKDSLSNKVLSFSANVKKGWTGSLAEKLGISSITSKLNMKLPKISIDWGYVTAFNKEFRYPKGFSIKWNATGAILNGAQLFGRVGNTLLGGGEAGREAVLPLDRNTWWMDKIADRVALRVTGGGQGGEQSITVNLVVDGKILASTVVRNVNAQARATGKHPFAAYI